MNKKKKDSSRALPHSHDDDDGASSVMATTASILECTYTREDRVYCRDDWKGVLCFGSLHQSTTSPRPRSPLSFILLLLIPVVLLSSALPFMQKERKKRSFPPPSQRAHLTDRPADSSLCVFLQSKVSLWNLLLISTLHRAGCVSIEALPEKDTAKHKRRKDEEGKTRKRKGEEGEVEKVKRKER